MNKLAIIVIGEHYAGKSRTLIEYVKPAFGLNRLAHKFRFNNCSGYIKTQTLQEGNEPIDSLDKFQVYDVFVLASRPCGEGNPQLSEIKNKLRELGFTVSEYLIPRDTDDGYRAATGAQIVNEIKKECV